MFVPVLAGIIFWKRLNWAQKLIFYIAILSALNHLASLIVREVVQGNNTWVYHIYVPILFWFTWRLYKKELKGILSKSFFKILLGIALPYFTINAFFIQGLKVIPTYPIFGISAIFIFWSFSYFYSLLKQEQYKPLDSQPIFWFTTGVLMYYSSTVLIFLLVYNLLEKGDESTYIAVILNALFNLVLVTTYLIAIWVKPQQ